MEGFAVRIRFAVFSNLTKLACVTAHVQKFRIVCSLVPRPHAVRGLGTRLPTVHRTSWYAVSCGSAAFPLEHYTRVVYCKLRAIFAEEEPRMDTKLCAAFTLLFLLSAVIEVSPKFEGNVALHINHAYYSSVVARNRASTNSSYVCIRSMSIVVAI